MNGFIKWLKYKLSFNKKRIPSLDVVGNYSDLSGVSTTFTNLELLQQINRDVVILIVTNNFIAEPANILSFFNRHYDFTLDEFIILSFRVGSMTKTYVENPIYLLEDAIEYKDSFTPETVDRFKSLLNEQVIHDENTFRKKYDNFSIKLKETKRKAKLGAKNIDADKQIDNWLKKNKKS